MQEERLIREHVRPQLLTVAVEDYFHATALNCLVPNRHWARMESRVQENTQRALRLLKEHDCHATFFVLGWVAERTPELVRAILDAGHEVASKGFDHRPIGGHSRESFRADVRRSKLAIEQAVKRRVLGYRVPQGHIATSDFWALRVLAEEGFVYDSSMYPRFRSVAREPWRRFPHMHRDAGLEILEFPLSTVGVNGLLLPAAGGNYMRQAPPFMHAAFRFWHERYLAPFNMYFHVWELDPDLPRIATADMLTRIRQYRNIERMPEFLSSYLARYRFTSIAEFSRFVQDPIDAPAVARKAPVRVVQDPHTPVSIVIPCFNESRVLSYLQNALDDVAEHLGDRYELHFVFVDDCSTDDTYRALTERFGRRADCQVVHHEVNQGVAAAILTGIRSSKTEIVCSMDADCTYDPRQLEKLLTRLTGDVVMVTASPYHPEGSVVGVPEWRLILSRNLSRLYGLLLHHRFATYTSCFRAYRKSALENMTLTTGGFLGVAEMLILLDVAGLRIAECPAVLEARLLGVSKLKTLRTMTGHLRLLSQIPNLKLHPEEVRRRLYEQTNANDEPAPSAEVPTSGERDMQPKRKHAVASR